MPIRIDRWLLAARLFKTRTLAQEACTGGKVEVNATRATPHRLVREGDRVRITTPRGKREITVQKLAERRLSPADAATLYDDLTPWPPPKPAEPAAYPPPEKRPGRPSKRDRRQFDRLRRG